MSLRIKIFIFLIFIIATQINALGSYNSTISYDTEPGLNVVIIDPGHGGKDFGTSVGEIKEKDIVLDIGLKLGKQISQAFPGIKVVYTRKKDIFIPLNKRAEVANNSKADLFISIHANYVGVKSVSGTETFVLGNHRSQDNLEIAKKENSVILLEENYITTYEGFDPNSHESYIMFETVQNVYLEQSLQFASFVQGQFKREAKRNDRGIKMAGFLVLRETTMPSVLVETGFISNEAEKIYINSEAGKSNLANAIFEAFCDYKNIIDEKSSFNLNVLSTSETVLPESNSSETKIITEPKAREIIKLDTEKSNDNKSESIIKIDDSTIWFRVQVGVTSRQIDLTSSNFNDEKDIIELQSGKYYKYYIGKYKDYNQASIEKVRLNKKFEGAFVVAFDGNKTIPIKEAIQKTKE
ncbi:MAG: N-acetylmuramoyl-L-alanine amidase [Mariniphaga sp.]|nr:N-acetylmuramoyl-L-alanine amidase [Mariniphaga sp.]